MTDVVIVLTTVPEDFDVDRLARTLVEAGHAACVSVGPPARSVYRWNGTIETATERPVTIKTTRGRVQGLEAALHDTHPYEVPELLVLPAASGSEAYLAWVRATTAE